VDNASFLASLAPDLQEEILLTSDEAFLCTLRLDRRLWDLSDRSFDEGIDRAVLPPFARKTAPSFTETVPKSLH